MTMAYFLCMLETRDGKDDAQDAPDHNFRAMEKQSREGNGEGGRE